MAARAARERDDERGAQPARQLQLDERGPVGGLEDDEADGGAEALEQREQLHEHAARRPEHLLRQLVVRAREALAHVPLGHPPLAAVDGVQARGEQLARVRGDGGGGTDEQQPGPAGGGQRVRQRHDARAHQTAPHRHRHLRPAEAGTLDVHARPGLERASALERDPPPARELRQLLCPFQGRLVRLAEGDPRALNRPALGERQDRRHAATRRGPRPYDRLQQRRRSIIRRARRAKPTARHAARRSSTSAWRSTSQRSATSSRAKEEPATHQTGRR